MGDDCGAAERDRCVSLAGQLHAVASVLLPSFESTSRALQRKCRYQLPLRAAREGEIRTRIGNVQLCGYYERHCCEESPAHPVTFAHRSAVLRGHLAVLSVSSDSPAVTCRRSTNWPYRVREHVRRGEC